MPKIANMLETMRAQGVSESKISQLPMPKKQKETPEELVAFIEKMDEVLTKEQCVSIMGTQGCCKHTTKAKPFAQFYEMHKDKTLAERIALYAEIDSVHKGEYLGLNDDGTITLKFGTSGKKGDWHCPCSPVIKLRPAVIPLTYCGCCGGHVLFTHEFALGVKLRLKEIVSSMANSDGQKPCEFIFEVV